MAEPVQEVAHNSLFLSMSLVVDVVGLSSIVIDVVGLWAMDVVEW